MKNKKDYVTGILIEFLADLIVDTLKETKGFLELELKQAENKEDYEKCIIIRDKLKKLES